jgi:HAD superfamily hydrolase (TIGR01662 family)
MTQLKAVLFDLDDTLIDWSQFDGDYSSIERPHFEGLHAHITGLGHPLPGINVLLEAFRELVQARWESGRQTLVAPHLPRILIEMLQQYDVPEDALNPDKLVEVYQWGKVDGTLVFPEVPQTLQTLLDNDIKIGIVTNAFQTMVMRDRELSDHGLLDYFATCRFAAADVGYLKPHPAIFEAALDCIGTQPEETVFVGDNLNADIAGAQRVGMKAVWRDTGYHNSRISLGVIEPDATLTRLDSIFTHLDGWFPGWRNDQ